MQCGGGIRDTLVTMTLNVINMVGSEPITRLNVQPPGSGGIASRVYKVGPEVTSLLMQAIPKTLTAEMIANRQLGAAQIVFKVMKKVYQPGRLGGATEHPASSDNNSTCRDVAGSFHVFENVAASPFTS